MALEWRRFVWVVEEKHMHITRCGGEWLKEATCSFRIIGCVETPLSTLFRKLALISKVECFPAEKGFSPRFCFHLIPDSVWPSLSSAMGRKKMQRRWEIPLGTASLLPAPAYKSLWRQLRNSILLVTGLHLQHNLTYSTVLTITAATMT